MKGAAHLQPVTWKSAEKGIISWFRWQSELDGDRFTWLNERRVGEDVSGLLWNVVFFQRFGIGDHGGGKGADGVNLAAPEARRCY